MMDDDVVETSDLEELEELRTPSNIGKGSSSPPHWKYDECPPRKRVRLNQVSALYSSVPLSASNAFIPDAGHVGPSTPTKSFKLSRDVPGGVAEAHQLRNLTSILDNHPDPLLLRSPNQTLPSSPRSSSVTRHSESPSRGDTVSTSMYEMSTPSIQSFPSCTRTRHSSLFRSSPAPLQLFSEVREADTSLTTARPFPWPTSLPGSPLSPLPSPQPASVRALLAPRTSTSDILLSHPGSFSDHPPNPTDSYCRQGSPLPVGEPRVTNLSRYQLRQRQPVQIAPYSVDKYQYKQALRHNPEAIVKITNPEKSRCGPLDHYEETQNETQDVEGMISSGSAINPSASTGHIQSKRSTPGTDDQQPPVDYPEILQDLDSSDDEERRALSMEAQQLLKARKARETRERRQSAKAPKHARPFPKVDVAARDSTSPVTQISDQSGSQSCQDKPPINHNDGPSSRDVSCERLSQREDHDLEQDIEHSSSGLESSSNSQTLQPNASGSSHRTKRLELDKRQLRALAHMMPKSMIRDTFHQQKPDEYLHQKRRRSAIVTSDDEGEYPLLPGQSRIRRATGSMCRQEIIGDLESPSDGYLSAASRMHSSDVEILDHSPRRGVKNHEGIALSDTESDASNSSCGSPGEEIAGDDIKAYLDQDGAGSNPRENLIDRMLSRTCTIGEGSLSRPRKKSRQSIPGNRNSRRRKYAIDIVTGAGRKKGKGRQMPLSFENHTSLLSRHEEPQDIGRTMSGDSRKRKARRQRTHQKTNGVYVFHDKRNARIVSGRNEELPISNVEVPRTPPSHDWASAFIPPHFRDPSGAPVIGQSKMANAHVPSEGLQRTVAEATGDENLMFTHDRIDQRRLRVGVHMDIRMLPSGISFGQDTFVGKGWLHELINVSSKEAPVTEITEPVSCHLRGYGLHSDMGHDSFLTTLQDICKDILEFSTELPDVEHAEELGEWNAIIRVSCRLLSWYYQTGNGEQRQRLRHTVETRVNVIVDRIQELKFNSKSLDTAALQLDWFAIELLVRAGCDAPPASLVAGSNVFHKAALLLMDHLVQLHPHSALIAVTSAGTLDSSTVMQRSAELWVCLIHLLGSRPPGCTSQKAAASFWSILLTCLQKRDEQSNLEASESIWRIIFCLCALSQFSVHGMTTSQPRLPTSWAVVLLALKKVRLAVNLAVDQKLPISHLDKRDKYIRTIMFRCLHLCDTWRWQLDDASDLFNELGEVFRSRKFSKLRYERPEYPLFMLRNDWSLLSQYEKEDSAFMLFLKLIVKAAKSTQGVIPSPKLKKLLSLAIPVGSLSFTKTTPPSEEELSMLFNRLSAVAIGIYLDPANYKTRISHARTYVAFASADDGIRTAVIRGMMNLGALMGKIGLPLDATAEWITELSSTLSDELKTTPATMNGNGTHKVNQNGRPRLHICIQLLLGSVRRILEHQMQLKQYPEPALIASLKHLLVNPRVDHERKTTLEIQRLVEALLNARSGSLPPPELPPIISHENSESQDEYSAGFDFDFDDPSLMAALGVDDNPSPHKVNEEKLYDAIIHGTNLFWFCWRHLTKFVQEMNTRPLSTERTKTLDKRIYCWLGCFDVLVRNSSEKSWSAMLGLRDEYWSITNDALRRRVDLGVATQLLRLCPMLYSTHVDMFFGVLLESLAIGEPTIECEYASLLLSIDRLQHPLLQGLAYLKDLDKGNFVISVADFPALRLPILKVIFSNLNHALEPEESIAAEAMLSNQKYIGYCIMCFSAMRSISSDLTEGSRDRQLYFKWCRQVFASLQSLDHLLSQPRLAYWLSWERSLEIS